MNDTSILTIMVLIAIATPLLGGAIFLISRASAASSEEALPPTIKRNALILAAAGPVNLAIWWILNRWLDRQGAGSVFGYILAAIVFIIAGMATGFFARLRGGR